MAGQAVIFSLGEEEYAMPIEVVREITRLDNVRPIPQAPSFVRGLINLRGQAVPLVDLHIRFGLLDGIKGQDAAANAFALIAELNGGTVGFAVDQVKEVRVLDQVLPPPLVTAPFIGGIVNLPDRIIMQVIPERILAGDELTYLGSLA